MRAPFLKDIPPFSCVVTLIRTPRHTPAREGCIPLGNRGVLRSQEGEECRKEGSGGEEKRRKRGRAKVLRFFLVNYMYSDERQKKRDGAAEMGTKPLKALREYRASNRGSKRLCSNRGSKGL